MSLSTLNHFSSNLNEFPFILEFSIYSLCLLFLLLRPISLFPLPSLYICLSQQFFSTIHNRIFLPLS
jgi:hypothetical protein